MSSIVPTNEEGRFDKAVDQKRQARVRGLLEQIPIDLYVTGGKGSTECPICIVEFEENDRIRFLPCMHNYHVECIDGLVHIWHKRINLLILDWLLRSFTCPSCMEPVDSAILSTFTTTSTDLSSLVCSPATNIKSGSSKSD